jgi:hypothetical protein
LTSASAPASGALAGQGVIAGIRDVHIVRPASEATLEVLRRLGAQTLAKGDDIRLVDIHDRDAAATVLCRYTLLAFSARRLMIVLEPSGSGL